MPSSGMNVTTKKCIKCSWTYLLLSHRAQPGVLLNSNRIDGWFSGAFNDDVDVSVNKYNFNDVRWFPLGKLKLINNS